MLTYGFDLEWDGSDALLTEVHGEDDQHRVGILNRVTGARLRRHLSDTYRDVDVLTS